MDPYFKPILLSSLIVLLLNTVFILPFAGAPFLSYVLGGALAVFFFYKDKALQEENESKFKDIKTSDAVLLGLGVGVSSGALLSLIFAIKIQDPEMQSQLLELINESIRMQSANLSQSMPVLDSLSPLFLTTTTIVTILICSVSSIFGSIMMLPFLNKKRQ